MQKTKEQPIEDYVFVSPTGNVRHLGPDFPANLDELGVGKLIGFPDGISDAVRTRLIGRAAIGAPRRPFRRAGVQLYLLKSASVRSEVADVVAVLAKGFAHAAGLSVALLVIVTACFPMSFSALNPKSTETLNSFSESFFSFAVKEHAGDKYRPIDIEKAKAEKKRYEDWKKENAHAE